MATVRLSFKWADGDELVTEVRVSESFPDALDEARAQAVKAHTEALAVATAEQGDE